MKIKYIAFPIAIGMAFIGLLLQGCNPPKKNGAPFEKGKALGTNKNPKLEEASGLVESAINPGYFWTINDSGNPAELFLLDATAITRKVFRLANVANRDWEDMTLGPGSEANAIYLYIGDIGDNLAKYPFKYIYCLKEPSLEADPLIQDFDTLIVRLPDGIRDSEALMSDPISKNLYLVSKRENNVMVYEISYPFEADTLLAKKVATLPLQNITAAAISPEGNEVLMKNYDEIYYWNKKDNESLADVLKTAPVKLPYDRELQGESVAWARDGSGYFTLGENAKGERAKLFFYKRN